MTPVRDSVLQQLAGLVLAMLPAVACIGQTGYFGTAKVNINPSTPVMLSGYAARSSLPEATGVQQDIFAQAAAFGIGGETALLLTIDCTGAPDNVVDPLASKLSIEHGIDLERIVVASTHSHSCPHVTGYLSNLYSPPLTAGEQQRVDAYTSLLSQRLEQVAEQALANRAPGHQISWANGSVGFGQNRRGQPIAPNDHDLPVMLVQDSTGGAKAIITSYATHAVTLNPSDNLVSGDWPGYARERIEAMYPGVAAMVMIGAGADSNPNAFGLAAAQNHGQSIANEVQRLINSNLMSPVSQQLAAFHSEIELDYATHLTPGDPFDARLAPSPSSAMYGITSWTFGEDLAMVFMEGEVVADYSLRLKAELGDKVWVNGYSNDVQGYIPSERILYEGGYEADSSTFYYAVPGRFAHGLEDKIVGEVHEHLQEFSDLTDRLRLAVDWASGEVSMANLGNELVEIQGYTISSPQGLLRPAAGQWNSFQAQGIPGWDRADNSNAFRLTEFNPTGSTLFAPGMSLPLGTPLTIVPPARFGDAFTPQDVHFEYQSADGEVIEGLLAGFSGDAPQNNLVLTIDPVTGDAAIQNESPFFDVSITAYTIVSEGGKLLTGNANWNSLQDQGLLAWDQADNANAFRLTEFKTTGATLLPGGETILDLGSPVNVSAGALESGDFKFEFLLSTGQTMEGVIEFGALPTLGPNEDFDDDGDVDGGDFLVWQRTFGAVATPPGSGADANDDGVVNATDLALWKAGFSAHTASLAAAVPEPASLAMGLWVLAIAGARLPMSLRC